MATHDPTSAPSYSLDREELLRIRNLKLVTSDRDYVFFALQIDYPGKLNPGVGNDSIKIGPFANFAEILIAETRILSFCAQNFDGKVSIFESLIT